MPCSAELWDRPQRDPQSHAPDCLGQRAEYGLLLVVYALHCTVWAVRRDGACAYGHRGQHFRGPVLLLPEKHPGRGQAPCVFGNIPVCGVPLAHYEEPLGSGKQPFPGSDPVGGCSAVVFPEEQKRDIPVSWLFPVRFFCLCLRQRLLFPAVFRTAIDGVSILHKTGRAEAAFSCDAYIGRCGAAGAGVPLHQYLRLPPDRPGPFYHPKAVCQQTYGDGIRFLWGFSGEKLEKFYGSIEDPGGAG